MANELPLCKCGCGLEVEKKTQKYYPGHYAIFRKTGEPVQAVKMDASELSKPVEYAAPVKKKKAISKPKVLEVKKLSKRDRRKQLLKNMRGCGTTSYLAK